MRTARRCLALTLLAAGPAFAQAPAGPEFRVNTLLTGTQLWVSVAADPAGNFVVVWADAQPSGSVAGRRLDATGMPRGAEFQINASTSAIVGSSVVATDAGGGFLVAWNASDSTTAAYDVFVRRFDAAGAPLTGDLRVNTYTSDAQARPALAVAPSGAFVAVWDSRGQDGDLFGVFGQRFDVNGNRLGAEFQVNSSTTGLQYRSSMAMDGGGNFVVVWESDLSDGSASILGQRFTAAGAPLGGEFRINDGTTGVHTGPVVRAAPAGEFVVAWTSGGRILARRFSAAGVAEGTEFVVDATTSGGEEAAASMNPSAFVIVWKENPGLNVRGKRFANNGDPQGRAIRLNATTSTHGPAVGPNVALDAAGNALAAWSSDHQSGPGQHDVYAQRYGLLDARALAVDTVGGGGSDGNGVLEPGEEVDVRPSWRNNEASARTLTATITSLTGPAGATYTVIDGAGSYGTVPAGSLQSCVDCYAVGVSSPPTRPAPHWDASARETIDPGDYAHFDWALHVGESFTDVPRTSLFYRFVETLLHRNVTTGCATGSYCPGGPATREQMAVFVLVAADVRYGVPFCRTPAMFADVPPSSGYCAYIEELARRGVVNGCGGGNYCPTAPVTREQMAVFVLRTADPTLNPPACTTPVFADVPASSPFCRWIEELARRGVVTGCGGGNYCPASAVTREQMSVFLTVTFGLTLYGP